MNRIVEAKITHNYRKARKGEQTCAACISLREQDIYGLDGEPRGFRDFRCTRLGLENSRRYAVNPKTHVCDCFVQTDFDDLQ